MHHMKVNFIKCITVDIWRVQVSHIPKQVKLGLICVCLSR